MVEVDRERGRIGLRLADDPEIAGKSIEELAAVGAEQPPTAPVASVRAAEDRPRGGDRGGRDRDRDRPRGGDRGGDRGGRVRDSDPDRG